MLLRDQLQGALGSAYTVSRELGGGGMSHVFVARDEALGRDVVVKVLPPELLAGVSADRFDREVRLAARLQHAHIVPVLSAGQMDGVPYYTMPFVEGASVRDRLNAGPLPVSEAVSVLRDVARALAYAHERGIVHRDIKPDNVLVAGGSAVVTDFGIAKALSAARTGAPGEPLTQVGISIGTPAYMAPEQAAADPATDHRADIYSFGCLAYELLAGHPPFTAKSPQRLLAAQMSEVPEPITALRPESPSALGDLVMSCLAKEPDARPQSATEILQRLDAATSGGTDAMPMLLARGRGMLVRALAIYALAFAIVAVLARMAISAIGLPDWVFPGALIVMALGLPVVLFTAYMHRVARALGSSGDHSIRQPVRRSSGTMASIATRARPHWSWRRTAIGGALALGGFVVLIAAYMVLRAFGIGPAGSLLAAGSIAEHEKLLVADLQSPASDTTLGSVVTDALRTALGQSRSVTVVQPAALQDALRRMQRPATAHVDLALAREIAAREGISAIIDGRVIEVGGRYVLSLTLVSQSGEELALFRETADDESELLPAIDGVAKQVRAKIGESLRSVQRTPALEKVTTPSLDALRKYVEGSKELDVGNLSRGSSLLAEAIALDSGFAMAYRRLAIVYGNRRLRDQAAEYYEKAFAHRDRLTDPERYLLLGSYYQNSRNQDEEKAREAYERLLELQPRNVAGINNLANLYREIHQYAKADSLYAVAIGIGPVSPGMLANRALVQIELGHLDSAAALLDTVVARFPQNPRPLLIRAGLLWTRGKYDSSDAVGAMLVQRATDPTDRGMATLLRAGLARVRGRLGDARRHSTRGYELLAEAGDRGAPLRSGLVDAMDTAFLLGDSARAARTIESALASHPIDSLAGFVAIEYELLANAYALAGMAERARQAADEWQRKRASFRTLLDTQYVLAMQGHVALATGRYPAAARSYHAADQRGCPRCSAPLEGRAWDLAGEPDSAITAFVRFLTTSHASDASGAVDGRFRPAVHKRLGELYEAKGDRERALRHYRAFIDLWKDADAVLQPKVTDARQRVAALTRGTETQ